MNNLLNDVEGRNKDLPDLESDTADKFKVTMSKCSRNKALPDLESDTTNKLFKVTRSKSTNPSSADEQSFNKDLVYYAKDLDTVQLRIPATNLDTGEKKVPGTLDEEKAISWKLQRVNDVEDDFADDFADDSADSSSCSSDSNNIDIPSSHNQSEDEDSPEAAVRRDTQNLRILRAFVVLGLLSAAVIVITFIYIYMTNAEEDAFRSEFDEIAAMIVDSFLLDTRFKFGAAQTIATTMTGLIETGAMNKLNMTVSSFDEITRAQRLLSFATMVAWSPILNTEEEREAFEEFAVTKESSSQSLSSSYGIFRIEEGTGAVNDDSPPPYHPIWLQSVLFEVKSSIMYNQFSEGVRSKALTRMLESKIPVMSAQFYREGDFYDLYGGRVGDPFVILYYPVLGPDRETVVGSIASEFGIRAYIQSVWPPRSDLVDIVLENSCGQVSTYKIDGKELVPVAEGDAREEKFRDMTVSSTFEDFDTIVRLSSPSTTTPSAATESDYCRYRFHVQATSELEAEYKTNEPRVFAGMAAAIFLFTSAVFIAYDYLVIRRQQKVMENARRSNAIVSSLFPKAFRDRLYEENVTPVDRNRGPTFAKSSRCLTGPVKANSRRSSLLTPKTRLKTFLVEDGPTQEESSEPIADLFPETTVMFLDIAGFTAWSSEREPTQVFTLLETVYRAFDNLADKLGVFKIETIGDSYVAVAGLPDPCADHAVVMAKFAHSCTKRMNRLTRQLEVKLGPSTGDLQARCGLHSGPVTAGILRGKKSRFQLFGDTMNTASRMESTGIPERIQTTKATADLLIKAGKNHWVSRRSQLVAAKGKGLMQTFWIDPSAKSRTNCNSSHDSHDTLEISDAGTSDIDWSDRPDLDLVMGTKVAQSMRLVEWNVDVLYVILQQIANTRQASRPRASQGVGGRPLLSRGNSVSTMMRGIATCDDEMEILESGRTVLEEFTEVIDMPRFDAKAKRRQSDDNNNSSSNANNNVVTLDPAVREQLRELILRLTALYRDVPFHNFEHASHVTMSAAKLLKRIVQPESWITSDRQHHEISMAKKIHESTYGISSDPLMHFAIVFSALIHDVDHTGLSNSDLISMQTSAAVIYKNKSVAEQNSVDVAWTVLMDSDFDELRACIYSTKTELRRFRQMVVNAVMATDIADRKLQALRKKRWDQAFQETAATDPNNNTGNNTSSSNLGNLGNLVNANSNEKSIHRKATIVFEYILQASDVAHTMQHWKTYIKWNERLFQERYAAYILHGKGGTDHQQQLEQDPALDWYTGELQFFDKYVIPLTERLKMCGVFGVSSHEFLNWALENRREWEQQGQELVQRMHEAAISKYGTKHDAMRGCSIKDRESLAYTHHRMGVKFAVDI
jgi:class 3 adenylate cyclase